MTATELQLRSFAEAAEAESASRKSLGNPEGDPGLNRIGHLLWELSNRVALMTDSSMGDTQLRAQSLGSLGKISETAGITVSDLARWAMKSQQAVSQSISRLERLGYVERRLGKGRGIELYITSAGKQALQHGNEAEGEFEREIGKLLGAGLYQRLHTSLQEARDVLNAQHRLRPSDT
jgi:DNA-binding MarR family transcriptional regulator